MTRLKASPMPIWDPLKTTVYIISRERNCSRKGMTYLRATGTVRKRMK